MTHLTGKTALVTGASRGIGRAIAERLAADGALVAVHYGHDEAAAKATVAAIEKAGGRAFPLCAELGVAGDIDTLFTGLERGLAGSPLDVLVNNAAIISYEATIENATQAQYDRVFNVNVSAPLFIVQRALRIMPDGGRIINVSSGVTWFAIPEVVYSMTKGALNVMTRSLAFTQGRRGITVNTVSPGITETDMNGWLSNDEAQKKVAAMVALGRHGQPAEIADAVAFFASNDGRWVSGRSSRSTAAYSSALRANAKAAASRPGRPDNFGKKFKPETAARALPFRAVFRGLTGKVQTEVRRQYTLAFLGAALGAGGLLLDAEPLGESTGLPRELPRDPTRGSTVPGHLGGGTAVPKRRRYSAARMMATAALSFMQAPGSGAISDLWRRGHSYSLSRVRPRSDADR